MVVDTSVLIAILFGEPEGPLFVEMLKLATHRLIGSPTVVEASIVVMARRGEKGVAVLRDLLAGLRIEMAPFTPGHAALAAEAFHRFGKGRHAAALNLGDCFSYALAKATGLPLLFKGEDFSRTDVKPAI